MIPFENGNMEFGFHWAINEQNQWPPCEVIKFF